MLNFTAGASSALCQRLLEPHGISLAQWVLLSALWREDGLTIGALAEYSGNAAPATSRIVDRMIERGLVAREPDPVDRRAVRIVLTPGGEALRHLADFYRTVNDILLSGFTGAEAATLEDYLARMERNARDG